MPLERARRFVVERFFAVEDSRSLSLFRFLYCLTLAVTLRRPHLPAGVILERYPETFRPILLFQALGLGVPNPAVFLAAHHVLVAALVCAAAGLLTRPALLVSWLAFLYYWGAAHGALKPPTIDVVGHLTDNVPWMLGILCAAPRVGVWGVDGWLSRRAPEAWAPAWPRKTVMLMFVLIYFGAVYCKLASSLRWPDGVGVQTIILEKVMQNDASLGLWAAHSRAVCVFVSVGCLLVESTFALALLSTTLGLLYGLAGLGMHAGMWAFMGLNYFFCFAAAYWVFLPWPGRPPRAARPPARAPVWAASFVVAIVAVNLACIFARYRAWPLSHWRFYPDRKPWTEAAAYRIQGVTKNGGARWLSPAEQLNAQVPTNNSIEAALVMGDRAWLDRRFHVLVSELRRAGSDYETLVVMERTVRRSERGRFEFVDMPIIRVRLDGSPARVTWAGPPGRPPRPYVR